MTYVIKSKSTKKTILFRDDVNECCFEFSIFSNGSCMVSSKKEVVVLDKKNLMELMDWIKASENV